MVFEYQNVEFFEFRSDIRRDHRRVHVRTKFLNWEEGK